MNAMTPQCWPPFPAPCPPPDCGCGGVNQAMDCWKQIAQFKAFLQQMLTEIGPYPVPGVTDGSQAAAGMIGEVFYSVVQTTFPITPFTQNINAGILQPGDWNIQAQCACVAAWTTGVYFNLSPVPAGIISDMRTVSGAVGTTEPTGVSITDNYLVSLQTQANVQVPTLLPFSVTTNYAGASTGGQPTGTIVFSVFGRRMR